MDLLDDTRTREGRVIYRPGARLYSKVPAQDTYDELKRIISGCAEGDDQPQAIVDASAPEDALLHDEFEWDDAKAANGFRRDRACYLARSVVLVLENAPPVRAFQRFEVTFTEDDEKRRVSEYVTCQEAMSDPERSKELIDRAWKDILATCNRYSNLVEFAALFEFLETFVPGDVDIKESPAWAGLSVFKNTRGIQEPRDFTQGIE